MYSFQMDISTLKSGIFCLSRILAILLEIAKALCLGGKVW